MKNKLLEKNDRIHSVNFSQIERELEEAICWLKNLGINPNRGRFGGYHKALKHLFNSYKNGTYEGDFATDVNAIYEVFDLIDIHKGLSDYEPNELLVLLNFYQKGGK